jgi:hypothetical protein
MLVRALTLTVTHVVAYALPPFLFGEAGLLALAGWCAVSGVVAVWNVYRISRECRRIRQRKRGGYVYIFYDVGQLIPVIKIGRGSNATDRLRAHRTAAPFGLVTLANIRVRDAVHAEAALHRRYQRVRVSARNEWFLVLTPVMVFELVGLAVWSRL